MSLTYNFNETKLNISGEEEDMVKKVLDFKVEGIGFLGFRIRVGV